MDSTVFRKLRKFGSGMNFKMELLFLMFHIASQYKKLKLRDTHADTVKLVQVLLAWQQIDVTAEKDLSLVLEVATPVTLILKVTLYLFNVL